MVLQGSQAQFHSAKQIANRWILHSGCSCGLCEAKKTVAPISTVESRESGESREQTLLAQWQDMMWQGPSAPNPKSIPRLHVRGCGCGTLQCLSFKRCKLRFLSQKSAAVLGKSRMFVVFWASCCLQNYSVPTGGKHFWLEQSRSQCKTHWAHRIWVRLLTQLMFFGIPYIWDSMAFWF